MTCSIEKELIEKTIEFHGHTCPGLTIGIRVAELAIKKLDIKNLKNSVCVTETDMCGVDAIQYLTGCTFGKGNLIHKDYGKSAFTFYDRENKKGFRAVFQDSFGRDEKGSDQIRELMQKNNQGNATDKEKKILQDIRNKRIDKLLNANLEDLFLTKEINISPVRPAKILESLKCEECNEMVMESRTRRFGGKFFCIPCFQTKEQKV